MSGVVLIITLPVLAAVLVYLLRRWPLPSTALAGLGAALLGILLWQWTNESAVLFLGRLVVPARPVVLLGQRLEMGPAAQWVIGLLALTLALAYLGSWQVSPGRSFFPFGLLMLPVMGTVLLVQPPWLAPIVLAAAASLAVFIIQAGRQGSVRGALRALWLPVLVIPLFLLAAWHLGQVPLDPEDALPLQTAARLASWGLLLLLAPWPLHGPALSLGEEAPPLVAAWLLTALAVIPVTLLQVFLTQFPWLQGGALTIGPTTLRLSELLVWGGLALSLWAGLAAIVQVDLSRLWSYAALHSMAIVLIALGLGARSSWGLVWLVLLVRTLALIVSGFGLAVIRERAGSRTDFASIRGLGTRLPLSAAAFLLGGLSLAGLPLTAGFAGQWITLQILGARDWVLAAAVLAGALGIVAGLLRSQWVLLGRLDNLLLERESRAMAILAGLGILAIVLLALRPQLLEGILSAAIEAFTATPAAS